MTGSVLLIDDDPNVLSALTRQLRKRFSISTAESGSLAVAAAEDSFKNGAPIAVAICDMHMPGMDGIETLKRIQDISPLTVGIMLTGDADQQTAIDALNSGNIFRFYAKPFDSTILGDGIASALRQHKLLQTEHQLAENEERWRLALEAVGDGVWDWDVTSDSSVYSVEWWRMLGRIEPPVDAKITHWWSLIHPDDALLVKEHIDQLVQGRSKTLSCEHRLLHGDGTYHWFLARGVALFRNHDGIAQRAIGTHSDVSERKEMQDRLLRQTDELRVLATTDPLTGLWNRRNFMEKAEAELHRSKRYKRPLSLIMVDIDFFKKVNDTLGHSVGDIVLRRVTDVLGANRRATDTIGRLGGEEFAVLLPETNEASALGVAESLRNAVASESIPLDTGQTTQVTASFGVATTNKPDDTITEILNRADTALYAAKAAGRNRVMGEPK